MTCLTLYTDNNKTDANNFIGSVRYEGHTVVTFECQKDVVCIKRDMTYPLNEQQYNTIHDRIVVLSNNHFGRRHIWI